MSQKSLIDSVKVKDACSEDWNEMRGTDKVRFCSHCSKHVNNLSEMTRKEAMRLVARSGGNLCIRYFTDPVSRRPLFAEQLLQITRRTPGLAAGVMSASIALSSSAYAQETSPVPATPPAAERQSAVTPKAEIPETPKRLARLSGTIVDQNGAVIPGAAVSIVSVDAAVTRSVTTSDSGEYRFESLAPGRYRLESQAAGFARGVRLFTISDGSDESGDLRLEAGPIEVSIDVIAKIDVEQVVSGGIGFVEYSTPLTKAVGSDDLEEAKELLINGADPNGKDENYDKITPLFLAVENGNVEMVEMLLNFGAKVNARDRSKQTPLMRLDDDATPELVELLIRHGAKVDAVDKEGSSALIMAAASANAGVLKALIDAGADVRLRNKAGQTALMEAASYDDIESVRALIAAGSEVNARNKEGESAWDLTSNAEIEAMLASHGAMTSDKKRTDGRDESRVEPGK